MEVTVDTNLLIWGVRQLAREGQEGNIAVAVALFQWLDANGHTVVLTTQAVAEYLTDCVDADDLYAQATALEQNFKIYSFDFRAALVAARIKSHPDYAQLRKELGRSRAVMNADTVIVASAKSNGVSHAYSDDAGFRSVAERAGLDCLPLPSLGQLLSGEVVPAPVEGNVCDRESPLVQLHLGLEFGDEDEDDSADVDAVAMPDEFEDWPDQLD